jgi:uncharacterized protein (DUF1800 family)
MKTVTELEKLKHLYWRTGCGPDVDILSKPYPSIETAVEEIFDAAQEFEKIDIEDFIRATHQKEDLKMMKNPLFGGDLSRSSSLAHIGNKWSFGLAYHKSFFREKMAYFWASHFPCRIGHVNVAVNYANILRKNCLGNFKDLLTAVTQSAGMLAFLNSNVNIKRNPNENFGREIMELFTLGYGNFSENEVKAVARAFTGWSFNDDTLLFDFVSDQHDYDEKTLFGYTQNLNGWDVIDIILEQRQCAKFVTTKIYKYFVNDNPDDAIINSLSTFFYDSNYNIELLMKKIFLSDWFYDRKNIGVKIKTPVDLLAGIIKFYDIKFEDYKGYLMCQRLLGNDIFHPHSVAGWNYEKGSIDSMALMMRMDASRWLFDESNFKIYTHINQGSGKPHEEAKPAFVYSPIKTEQAFFTKNANQTASALIDFLIHCSDIKFNVSDIIDSSSENPAHLIAKRIMSTPEYQFC